MTWPALRWWRRTAFALLALTSAVVAYQWNYMDRRPLEERFELASVDSGAVDPEWRAMPTVAAVSYADPEGLPHATLPLGPFRLVGVDEGFYFGGVDFLNHVRLCDPSDCAGSAVVLRPKPVPLRLQQGHIPDGTWRLRHDLSKGHWLVSYAPPEDTSGPEDLVVAVLRVPVPLGVQRPPDALVCLLGAGFLALSVSLCNTLRARRGWSIGEGDDVLTGALLALVIASALVAARSTGRVEPAWDLEVREAVRPPDWRSWSRVDMVHGPFTWPDYFFQRLDARAAMLGSLELQSGVSLDRMPPYEREVDARVCSAHSCVRVDPPPEDPCGFVVGLVHVPGSELWAVTFADEKHGEQAVSVPWLRPPCRSGAEDAVVAVGLPGHRGTIVVARPLQRSFRATHAGRGH